ncbi:MAG: acyl carrier protein [Ruminococcaceae bacterium]|nr:acyl carrier protein [Oscillospiraceae bacterium]
METLLKILNGLHPDVDFEAIDDLYDEGVLDSLDMVRLVTEIGMEFDVQIPAEELIPENFQNVNTIMALIERLDEE